MQYFRETNVKTQGFVRDAGDADIETIRDWLDRYPGVDSLSVNWPTTLHVYQTRGMLVFEDHDSKSPVAYFWGDLAGTESVLEIRYDKRGQGIGREFVDYLIAKAREAGSRSLSVECAPHTSQAFWRRMGFTVSLEGNKLVGRRELL